MVFSQIIKIFCRFSFKTLDFFKYFKHCQVFYTLV